MTDPITTALRNDDPIEGVLGFLYAAWLAGGAAENLAVILPLGLVNGPYHSTMHPFCELGRALRETVQETIGTEILRAIHDKRPLTPAMVSRAEQLAVEVGQEAVAELDAHGLELRTDGTLGWKGHGHPCRDCGKSFEAHPTAACEAWA